jgi:TPR repeat protein
MKLAQAYREGDGVEKDFRKAVHWYQLIVDRNDSAALKYEIGELYRTGGPGLPKDQVGPAGPGCPRTRRLPSGGTVRLPIRGRLGPSIGLARRIEPAAGSSRMPGKPPGSTRWRFDPETTGRSTG